MAEMDANAAFDAVQTIARSSKNLADMESMKARARMAIDQFRAAMATEPRTMAKREEKVLRQYLDGACATRRVDEVARPVFIEARNRLIGKA